MRSFAFLAAAIPALISSTLAAPITVHPGGIGDIVITSDNTINGTDVGKNNPPSKIVQSTAQLPLAFVNNFSGGSINAYVTGKDSNGKVVILKPDGSFYYPDSAGSATPVLITANLAIPLSGTGSTTNINIPDYISASRIWFAEGELKFFVVATASGEGLVEPSAVNLEDPSAAVNWGFVELTNNDSGIYANISYVDFVGLILGMQLTAGDGSLQTTKGLQADAVASICNDLKTQAASDGLPWEKLCVADTSGNLLRVLSPNDYSSIDSTSFANYWSDYADQVWSQYTSNPLTVNTQAAAGSVTCQVSGDTLNCDGDNRGYAKPSAIDIWGCNSGPFAITGDDNDVHRAVVPRLCAAFVRSTLLLEGGNTQPGLESDSYYTVSPTSHYSRIVHDYEADGKGYAFPYDDVNPDGDTNQSGVVSDANPQLLTIYIGGPSS